MSYRPIFGKPRLTQDWGDEQHERETHWTSLFYDLIIVAALNAIAEPFEEVQREEDTSNNGSEEEGTKGPLHLLPIKALWLNALLQFISVLTPWNSLNEFTSMFEDESFIGHLCFFVHCFGLACTASGCVGELEDNYKTLAIGIILTKFGLLVLYARPLWYIPRARAHNWCRCASFSGVILLMIWGLSISGPDSFRHFRILLIVASVWDWVSLLLITLLNEQRLPLHVQSYADRQKEVTMVIFGEAIFAVTLQPKSSASTESHYYLALSSTLWLIYGLALQEFHIVPNAEDHALKRSLLFGFSWFYTQFFKQVFLLGASIGLKRAHLLALIAPEEPIDVDTRNLLVWGISLTLLAVVLIRSYSLGYGRHPSKYDPASLWRIKVVWWTALGILCLGPQLVDHTILNEFPEPLLCLVSLGAMLFIIILFEAFVSNVAASVQVGMNNESTDELTYLRHSSEDIHHQNAPFLRSHAPKCDTATSR